MIDEKQYRINSIFPTFQGEGKYAGERALFIRLAHCNLSCEWCDTEFNSYKKYTLEKLKKAIKKFGRFRYYVITGGEPTINPVFPHLIKFLDELRYSVKIIIESNGTSDITRFENTDKIYYTISPKQDTENIIAEPFFIHPNNYKRVNEFKLVIDKHLRSNEDYCLNLMGDLAKSVITRTVIKSLSPEYSEMKENINFIYNLIKKHDNWKLSLQTHKWIGYE